MTLKQNFITNPNQQMESEDKNEKYKLMISALEKKVEEIKNKNEALAGRY